MRPCRGPSPMPAEEYGRPDKYYEYLDGAAEGYIILENGPSSLSHPVGVSTGAERRSFAIHLQSSFKRRSIHLQSITLARPGESRLGKAQIPTLQHPNDYPKRRVLEGLHLPSVSPSPVTSL